MPKTMLERVLIPLDGSSRAESIVPLLDPILQLSGSEIFLVRALAPAPSPGAAPFQEADQYLRSFAERFLEEGICAHTRVGVGSPPQVIETLAADEEVTLIAMATQGGTGDEVVVGPVLERMLRESARPVLALRPEPGRRTPSFRPHRSLLVPLDGSEPSRRSLPLALELAGALHARVILMRVIERVSEQEEALRDLHGLAERLNRGGWIAEVWVANGDPGEKILEVCRDQDIQLIVLTTEGRSGPSDRLFGSVTRQLLKQAPVPVLALHVRG